MEIGRSQISPLRHNDIRLITHHPFRFLLNCLVIEMKTPKFIHIYNTGIPVEKASKLHFIEFKYIEPCNCSIDIIIVEEKAPCTSPGLLFYSFISSNEVIMQKLHSY